MELSSGPVAVKKKRGQVPDRPLCLHPFRAQGLPGGPQLLIAIVGLMLMLVAILRTLDGPGSSPWRS